MGEKAVVHLHAGILLSHKKEGDLNLATAWMDPESVLLSEISQSGKDKNRMISFIREIMNKINRRTK